MDKTDYYLLQGIFDHEPEAMEYKMLVNENYELPENTNTPPPIRKMETAMLQRLQTKIKENT